MKQILFNSEMVRALLDGRKTATRRTVRFAEGQNPHWTGYVPDGTVLYVSNNIPAAKAHYRPGDILYVRESFRLIDFDYIDGDWSATVQYKADNVVGERMHYLRYGADEKIGWRPSIHMPKEAARIFLRVKDVRVERLQDITEAQAKAEGCVNDINLVDGTGKSATMHFAETWKRTVKSADLPRYGWNANPWVWAIEFKIITKQEASDE